MQHAHIRIKYIRNLMQPETQNTDTRKAKGSGKRIRREKRRKEKHEEE
jgi:hypothetical protein